MDRKSMAVAEHAPIAATLEGPNFVRIISTIRVRSAAVPPHRDSVTRLSGVGETCSYKIVRHVQSG